MIRRFLLRLLGARTDNCGCNCGCAWCQSWDEDAAAWANTTTTASTDLYVANNTFAKKG